MNLNLHSDGDSRRARGILILTIVAGVISRLPYLPFKIDDAFIYARYATNLANGLGLVFNEGERVSAITSPLYALLLSFFVKVFTDPVRSANLMALLLYIPAQIIVWHLCLRIFRDQRVAILSSMLFALGDVSNRWWMAGLETPLFVTIALACLLTASTGSVWKPGLLAGLAILARPDGVLLVPLLFIRTWWVSRNETGSGFTAKFVEKIVTLIVTVFIPLIPWLLFSKSYYGTILQSSAVSKVSMDSSTYGTLHYLFLSYQLNLKGYAACLFFLLPALLSALLLLRKRNIDGVLLTAWSVGQLGAYVLAMVPIAYWYLAPGFMGVYLLAGHGLILARDGLASQDPLRSGSGSGPPSTTRWFLPTMIPVLAILFAIGFNGIFAAMSRSTARNFWEGYGQVGEAIRNNSEEGDWVAAGDVGIIGHVSQRPILDFGGLLQPEVLQAYRRGDLDSFVLDRKPKFIVLSTTHMNTEPFRQISDSPRFHKEYDEYLRRSAFGLDYVVFRRSDTL